MKMAIRLGVRVWKTIMVLNLVVILVHCSFGLVEIEALSTRLPDTEVQALREIATQIGKDWNFRVDPCRGWTTPNSTDNEFKNILKCNCSFPDGPCHVTNLILKGQDLAGVLPPSIAKLPNLTEINFAKNFLSGNIPSGWASTKLEYISLSTNNLSGPILAFLGNITTLTYLSLESNMFSGTVPPELGNLVNLQRLIINANNLTGVLPLHLTNLTKLTELRISSNNFTGIIPDFFRSWSQLEKLEIQGSGLQGPIPSSISVLSNLTELRISNLNGGGSKFPNLTNMKSMKRLMLRSCNLYGPIPDLTAMKVVIIIDLSFNQLEGRFPELEDLALDPENLRRLYLTSNLLNGSIPKWTKNKDNSYQIDVSYNNFSKDPEQLTCRNYLNNFKSYSAPNINSLSGACLQNYPCKKDQYELHINCGGAEGIVS